MAYRRRRSFRSRSRIRGRRRFRSSPRLRVRRNTFRRRRSPGRVGFRL